MAMNLVPLSLPNDNLIFFSFDEKFMKIYMETPQLMSFTLVSLFLDKANRGKTYGLIRGT